MQDQINSEETVSSKLWIGHILPFIAWVAIMALPFPASPLKYGLQSLATLITLLLFKPWRLYSATIPTFGQWMLGIGVGILVAIAWILPETSWITTRWPSFHEFYFRYAIRSTGASTATPSPWAPQMAGWTGVLIRWGGSALVIAVVEEFFWRGFLMRWIAKRPWASIPFSAVPAFALIISAIVFGLEHDRWLVGIFAGLMYGALCRCTNSLFPALAAHVVTNALIGLYVLAFDAYRFW